MSNISREASKPSEHLHKDAVSNPLSKKLNKILETRLDNDKEVLEALKSLSVFFNENNIRTRRSLRSNIEKRTITINENFIEAFSVVKQKLDKVYNEVQSMNQCCKEMTTQLKETKNQTHDLIRQTTKLQIEGQNLQLRSQMVEIFLKKFQLSEQELLCLKGNKDGHLTQEFFSSLVRVKQIHSDCKILLRTSHQTAGLEIMESMALHQEAAYERLYRWTQNECCQLTNDHAEISSQLCQAIQALQDRPVLFKYSLDEFSGARRTAVVRAFIDAMTRGGMMGGSKSSRPIELHSHDPLRYLGDMLAWVHQTCASEKEHLMCLLKNVHADKMDETILAMLKHIMEGLCRPFKMRIEQVLTSEQSVTSLYKLSNLLQFYKATIGQMMPNDKNGLVFLLDESVTLAFKLFFSALSLNASRLLDTVEAPSADFSAPNSLSSTLKLLREILSSDEHAVAVPEDRESVCAQILSTVVEPLISMCTISASGLDTASNAVYMLNNLYLIHSTLLPYQHTQAPIELIQLQMQTQVETLMAEQASVILNHCKLASLITSLQKKPPNTPLSLLAGTEASKIKEAMICFDKYLSDTASLTLDQCLQIHSTKYREIVRKGAADLVGRAYKELYQALCDPANQYPLVQTIAPLSFEQVSKLLD